MKLQQPKDCRGEDGDMVGEQHESPNDHGGGSANELAEQVFELAGRQARYLVDGGCV